jgi:hypothetical protein
VQRGCDADLKEAQAAIQRLAAMPDEQAFLLHEVIVLRLRGLLARARCDEEAYRSFVDRYREMASPAQLSDTTPSARAATQLTCTPFSARASKPGAALAAGTACLCRDPQDRLCVAKTRRDSYRYRGIVRGMEAEEVHTDFNSGARHQLFLVGSSCRND